MLHCFCISWLFTCFCMESILNTIKGMDSPIINRYMSVIGALITKNKKPINSISAAIAISILCRYFYRLIFLPPKSLQNFPVFGYIDILNTRIKKADHCTINKEVLVPLSSRYNGFYVQPIVGLWIIKCNNTQAAKTILADQVTFPKPSTPFRGLKTTLLAKFFLGDGLLNLEGQAWKRHRQIVSPFVHQIPPISQFGLLALRSFALMETFGLTNNDIGNISGRMALDAIALNAFGSDFESTSSVEGDWFRRYCKINRHLFDIFHLLFPILDRKLLWLMPERRKAHIAVSEIQAKIDEMIAKKRESIHEISDKPNNQKDLLTLMLETESGTEKKLTLNEMKSNIVAFFFAGQETTASALSSTVLQLARNKDIQRKAREEVLRIMGDDPVDKIPTSEQLREMEYLDCIIKETLRLCSPAITSTTRLIAKDTILNGVLLPQGHRIQINFLNIHMDSQLWEDPFEYRPERFMNKSSVQGKEELKWLPFGYGPHTCLGMNFSITEQRVFICMLLRKFEWELPKDSIHKERVVLDNNVTLKPRSAISNFRKRY
ncbi:cytochrome P450 [Pilobolus umbonatus]|nr:cytochrome P450 [Pilobolus umbonatus]